MTAFTPGRLAELRALCEAATPGLWDTELDDTFGDDREMTRIVPRANRRSAGVTTQRAQYAATVYDRRDAAFIAAARTALPDALLEIERQAARIAELESLISHTACTIDIWNSVDADGDEMEQVLVDTSGMLKTALGGDPTKDARDQPEILRHIPERAK